MAAGRDGASKGARSTAGRLPAMRELTVKKKSRSGEDGATNRVVNRVGHVICRMAAFAVASMMVLGGLAVTSMDMRASESVE